MKTKKKQPEKNRPTLFLGTNKLLEDIFKAKKQADKGKFLTHEEVFGKDEEKKEEK